jgi:hypothetical protein
MATANLALPTPRHSTSSPRAAPRPVGAGVARRRRRAVGGLDGAFLFLPCLADELQPHDTADEAEDEEHLHDRERFVARDHGVRDGQRRTDPDPHGVGGAGRDVAHGPGETAHAGDERDTEDHRRPELREALRLPSAVAQTASRHPETMRTIHDMT